MRNVYVVGDGMKTDPLKPIRCKDEGRELQLLLEQNPELLPGDQINPDEPRRWMVIKREMPVPDPGTGQDRWEIDFLFADQDAVPTFVECKRIEDTRARREIVGQVLEYAANGHFYWDKQRLRDLAEEAAEKQGRDLEPIVHELLRKRESIDGFFERMEDNLREGQIRIVFFMDDSPIELRSIIDFLNKQMERSDVLLVEACQYEMNGGRIVVPTLFGYTEEARRVKRTVTVSRRQNREKWDADSFFSQVDEQLTAEHAQALRELYESCRQRLGFDVDWGQKGNGSCILSHKRLSPKTLLWVWTHGKIQINCKAPMSPGREPDIAEDLKNIGRELDLNFRELTLGIWKSMSSTGDRTRSNLLIGFND